MGESLKNKVEELAAENERSVSDFIRLVLKEYMEALEERYGVDSSEGEQEE
jgi:hypothetical protein